MKVGKIIRKRVTRITQRIFINAFLDVHLNTLASSSSQIAFKNFIFQTLAENSQVLLTISHQIMCKVLVLLNTSLVVTLYILISIRGVNLTMNEIMLRHVWLIVSKRWVIFPIPSWESSPFCADNEGVQNKNRIVIWSIIFIIDTVFFSKATLLFYVQGRGSTNNAACHLLNILKG